MLRVYLDNCTFNRPFDDQNQVRIEIEAKAKLYIQEKIKNKEIELVWSYILEYENSLNPFEERRNQIVSWKKWSGSCIYENKAVIKNAEKILQLNIKRKDSLHLACAIEAKSDYFITTDDLLIKKAALIKSIAIILPTTFIELEEI